MKLLHCNNTATLANKISNAIGIEIAKREIDKFQDGEINIKIQDDLYQKDVLITCELFPNISENLLLLLFLINSAKKRGAKTVHAIVPYFAYSRMDHKKNNNDFIAASCVASLVEAAGLHTLITIDLHSSQIEGFFRIPVKNISILDLLQSSLNIDKNQNTTVVSPDIGGKLRSASLSEFLDAPIAVIYKQRDSQNKVAMNGIMGNVKGMDCILVDDIISSGQTMINAIDILQKAKANRIQVIASHSLIKNEDQNLKKILNNVDALTISNSVQNDYVNLKADNLNVIDVSVAIINCIKAYF